jgi:hypothetical protein
MTGNRARTLSGGLLVDPPREWRKPGSTRGQRDRLDGAAAAPPAREVVLPHPSGLIVAGGMTATCASTSAVFHRTPSPGRDADERRVPTCARRRPIRWDRACFNPCPVGRRRECSATGQAIGATARRN